jgi:hypothetical protein
MGKVVVERIINKPLDKVWEVIGDFMRSPGPSITVIPGKKGDPDLHGIGAERTIKFDRFPILERLESINPPNSLSFSIVSGAPVKSLLLEVELMAMGEATKIKWTGTFIPKSSLLGYFIPIVTRRNINMFLNELGK